MTNFWLKNWIEFNGKYLKKAKERKMTNSFNWNEDKIVFLEIFIRMFQAFCFWLISRAALSWKCCIPNDLPPKNWSLHLLFSYLKPCFLSKGTTFIKMAKISSNGITFLIKNLSVIGDVLTTYLLCCLPPGDCYIKERKTTLNIWFCRNCYNPISTKSDLIESLTHINRSSIDNNNRRIWPIFATKLNFIIA